MTAFQLPDSFNSRPPQEGDIPALTKMLIETSLEISGKSDFTEKEMENFLRDPVVNPQKDLLLVFSPEGEIAGYQECVAKKKIPAYPQTFGRVPKKYRKLGIGSFMLDWALKRARRFEKKVPQGARVAAQAVNLESWQPSKSLLDDFGFQIFRHAFVMRIDMTAPPPAPKWPEGITVRQVKYPEEFEEVFKIIHEAFGDHFGAIAGSSWEDDIDRFRHHWLNDRGFDPQLWYAALEGDKIVGACINRKWDWEDNHAGHVSDLGVLAPWRKRGIGMAFLQHSFGAFWERGQKSVSLDVDASNLTNAVQLYKKAGMRVFRRYDQYELELRPGKDIRKQ
ncbi:MAG: GNAT family N-acetyltransferase [Anaerolineae bacterium]|nr:GNAT family N-acetyltransferase [Anaerolineae bacterium]